MVSSLYPAMPSSTVMAISSTSLSARILWRHKEKGGAVFAAAHGYGYALAILDHGALLHSLCHYSLEVLNEMALAEMKSRGALRDYGSLAAPGADHAHL